MFEKQMSRSQVEGIKNEYPPGTRIMLNLMNDPIAPVSSGVIGTVKCVDDAGQIHMHWDNGRTLAIVPGVDDFRKLTEDELAEEITEQEGMGGLQL